MFPQFLTRDVETVAQKLLGCFLESSIEGKKVLVRIVETEAYDENDEASRGKLKEGQSVVFTEKWRDHIHHLKSQYHNLFTLTFFFVYYII